MTLATNGRNFGKLFFTLALVTIACTQAGCLSTTATAPIIDYYTLDYQTDAVSDKYQKLPVIIKVENFTVSPPYDSDKISYRENNTVSTYNYHRWRANPADLLSYYITRDLQAGELFEAVLPSTSAITPTHILEGIVDEFVEIDSGENWYASMAFTLTLSQAADTEIDKKILLQKSFSHKVLCKDKNPLAVSQAMAEALKKISAEANLELYRSMK